MRRKLLLVRHPKYVLVLPYVALQGAFSVATVLLATVLLWYRVCESGVVVASLFSLIGCAGGVFYPVLAGYLYKSQVMVRALSYSSFK